MSMTGGSNRKLLDLDVHIWRSHRISWTSMSIVELEKFLRGVGGRRGTAVPLPAGDADSSGGNGNSGFQGTLVIWLDP